MSQPNKLYYKKYNADSLTPVLVYGIIKEKFSHSVLYESVEKAAGKGRYSMIACHPDAIWVCDSEKKSSLKFYDDNQICVKTENSLSPLKQLKEFYRHSQLDIDKTLPSAVAGLFGYFSYDAIRLVEDIPQTGKDNLNIPDGYLFRPRIVIIFDSVYDSLLIVTNDFDGTTDKNSADNRIHSIEEMIRNSKSNHQIQAIDDHFYHKQHIIPHQEKSEFLNNVLIAQEYIKAGDAFQIVLSQRFSSDYYANPFDFYRCLRRINPSPYMFYFDNSDFVLAGASPEILVRNHNNTVTIRPIAGTRPRGKTPQEDLKLEKELLNDEKEIAEHLMLLDLGRNDVGRISEIGSVNVTAEYIVERYSHVMHIVSNVEGQLLKDKDFIDAFLSALPAGTVSGAPKIRAMHIIDELETEKRSFYAGGIGYFSANGNGDFSIMLRTAMIKDNKIYFQAGAGVVADSNPESEYTETINKAAALVKTLEMVNQHNNRN